MSPTKSGWRASGQQLHRLAAIRKALTEYERADLNLWQAITEAKMSGIPVSALSRVTGFRPSTINRHFGNGEEKTGEID